MLGAAPNGFQSLIVPSLKQDMPQLALTLILVDVSLSLPAVQTIIKAP